ncbi:MAG: hypothetical protein AB8B57_09970 [Congregibacter sp.]
MSLFRILKYSSIIYFLGRHKSKLLRSVAVLLFAFVTSLLYEDVRVYLAQQHPGTLIYALLAKILIVYGSLIFVLMQFRAAGKAEKGEARADALASQDGKQRSKAPPAEADRLDALANVEEHGKLRSKYERVLAGESHAPNPPRESEK